MRRRIFAGINAGSGRARLAPVRTASSQPNPRLALLRIAARDPGMIRKDLASVA
jgi:hypothetical protein